MWLSSNACLKKIGRKYVYIILSFNKCSHAKQMIRQVDSTTFTLSIRLQGGFVFKNFRKNDIAASWQAAVGVSSSPKELLQRAATVGKPQKMDAAVQCIWKTGMLALRVFFSHVHIAAIVSVSCLVLCWMNRGVQISNMWWNGVSAKTPGNFDTELLWDAFKLKTWKLIYDHTYRYIQNYVYSYVMPLSCFTAPKTHAFWVPNHLTTGILEH